MKLYAGTSGYSYKEWIGSFYPEKTTAADMLALYAAELPTVEINNTFYRIPKAPVVASWAAETPDDFRFVLKASQRITHRSRLKESAYDSTAFMLEQFGALGEKLGAILFQLPANVKPEVERLAAFVEQLPDGTRAAFEFRHAGWFSDATYDVLRARDFALVLSSDDDESIPCPPLDAAGAPFATADWGYLRLRRMEYDDDELERWIERARGFGWSECFAFFKHEDGAAGTRAAKRFLALGG